MSATRPADIPRASPPAATGGGDPGPEYSTHLGGTSNDFGIELAVDDGGNTYVTGQTVSADLPTTPGVLDTTHNGSADAFVMKLDAAGSVVYSTYLGGSGAEAGLGIAVDDAGNAYVSGGTASPDFPVTAGAVDTSHNGFEDVFVAKLNPDGSAVLWATFLGGGQVAGDFAPGIAVDRDGNVYVSGGTGSPEFPTTPGAHDTTHNGADGVLDSFVAKLDPTGSTLVYSTFLGGKCNDATFGIAVDDDGRASVAGDTVSEDLPTTGDALDRRHNGDSDSFVAKLDADGSGLVFSTYLGGEAADFGRGIVLDSEGAAYLTGWTSSSDLPTTRDAFDRRHNGREDAFVAKLAADGSELVYSTYLGGKADDRSFGLAVDSAGNLYAAGSTKSADWPVTDAALETSHRGATDGFVATLNRAGSKLTYSTYLGGDSLDFVRGVTVAADDAVYVTGRTESSDFPTMGVSGSGSNGGRDAFVTRLTVPASR